MRVSALPGNVPGKKKKARLFGSNQRTMTDIAMKCGTANTSGLDKRATSEKKKKKRKKIVRLSSFSFVAVKLLNVLNIFQSAYYFGLSIWVLNLVLKLKDYSPKSCKDRPFNPFVGPGPWFIFDGSLIN